MSEQDEPLEIHAATTPCNTEAQVFRFVLVNDTWPQGCLQGNHEAQPALLEPLKNRVQDLQMIARIITLRNRKRRPVKQR